MSMILELQKTWPIKLINFLNNKYEQLVNYAKHEEYCIKKDCDSDDDISHRFKKNPFLREQEEAIEKVSDLLQSTTLRGWHCTRLTKFEVKYIIQHGMQLPNLRMLKSRISRLQKEGIISDEIAKKLKNINYADETCRRGIIWFCFFSPRSAGQSGLEIFFRYWGGEALSRAHQQDPETKNILMNIGQPCLIEVEVPISALPQHSCFSQKVILRYLVNRGFETGECIEHEDKSIQAIPAQNISKFIFYDDPKFIKLVGCDQWEHPL